ncbi:MAG: hypothetical protein ACOYB7_13650 [Mycobacterium sp.]
MHWSRFPNPEHLVHDTVQGTVTVIVWLATGVIMTAIGGLTASRAKSSRRVSAGMALTLGGVIVLAAGVWFHKSMPL